MTLTTDNLPQHSHSYQAWSQVSDDWKSGGNASPGDGTGNANQSVQTGEAGSSASFSILPPFYCLYYIMKR